MRSRRERPSPDSAKVLTAAGLVAVGVVSAACSPNDAPFATAQEVGPAPSARAGCPKTTLTLDSRGRVFRNGISVDNALDGAGVARANIASSAQGPSVEIATEPDGSVYWNCEKISQAEFEQRFVAVRTRSREAHRAAPAPDAGAPPSGGSPP